MRSASAAVAYSRRYTHYRTQYCLNFVQTMLGAPWSGPSAVWAWNHAKGKHGPDAHPPAGVPVWILGSHYGHIALSVGGGRIRSTDFPGRGHVGEVGIYDLAHRWGRHYVGWAEYLGGQKIPGIGHAAPSTPHPTQHGHFASGQVYVHMLKHGVKDSDSVRNVQRRLMDLGFHIPAGPTGNWFSQTDHAVRAIQRKWNQPAQYATGRSMGPRQTARLFRGVHMAIKP